MEIVNTELADLYYDETVASNMLLWKTPPSSTEFREVMTALANQIIAKKNGDIITDTTHLGTIDPDDQVWSATTWTDLISEVDSVRKLGLILPEEIFTQLSVESTLDMVKGPVDIKYFKSLDEAKTWVSDKSHKA